MIPQTNCQLTVFLVCTLLLSLSATDAGPTFECELEKRADENVCVFRNVMYASNTTSATFKAPSGKIQHVAFEDSTLEQFPKELLNAFPDLRSLSVPNTNLTTLIIPTKLERLIASDNQISHVVVHQARDSTTMLELMLDSNHLRDVSNLTRLAKLEILNLSGNKELPNDGTIELGRFKGMNGLRHLLLSDVGAYYLENENDVSLPELELLDLSNNNLLTSSLNVKVFAPMKSLQILRIGYNQLNDLDVMQLTQNNEQLKQIYLEGNHFKCDQQRLILDHLSKAGVETPITNKQAQCVSGFEKQDNMCCMPEMPGSIGTQVPPKQVGGGQDNRMTDRTSTNTESGMVHGKGSASTSTVTPSTSAPAVSVPKSNEDGKSVATMVTLGNHSWLGVLTLLGATIAKLILF
ncbi:platelet glycoprotein V-like [Anopheles maculipalpis]|uniref:platelet glycoprotein V-like n=1 Tax=Anopheles maculipalpis TaxID=1496333 RepID=UPI0021597084|nr:platelet glycoprotein V-like [Anopheles maculipalpis]